MSRLGHPLVNELVIGLKDKDRFNASEPQDDAQLRHLRDQPDAAGADPGALRRAGAGHAAQRSRAVFLTGVPGLNQPASVRPAEMLRLNTSIAPKAPAAQSPLGVLGGDIAGFPNGRRPGDDVVDIALRAVEGVLLPGHPAAVEQLTDGALSTATIAYTPDGAITGDAAFRLFRASVPLPADAAVWIAGADAPLTRQVGRWAGRQVGDWPTGPPVSYVGPGLQTRGGTPRFVADAGLQTRRIGWTSTCADCFCSRVSSRPCIGALAAPLAAHDFWIEPTGFSVDLGRVVGVKLRVGDDFHGDPVPRSDDFIDQFVVVDAGGRRQVVGREGADPAGLLRVTAPGLMIIGYQSRPEPGDAAGRRSSPST